MRRRRRHRRLPSSFDIVPWWSCRSNLNFQMLSVFNGSDVSHKKAVVLFKRYYVGLCPSVRRPKIPNVTNANSAIFEHSVASNDTVYKSCSATSA